jgi:hypothetical protein
MPIEKEEGDTPKKNSFLERHISSYTFRASEK